MVLLFFMSLLPEAFSFSLIVQLPAVFCRMTVEAIDCLTLAVHVFIEQYGRPWPGWNSMLNGIAYLRCRYVPFISLNEKGEVTVC